MKDIEFFIPWKLKLRDILRAEGKSERYILNNMDKYYWFINHIYLNSILNKKYSKGDFIPMHNDYMRDEVLGCRYLKDILRILPKHNIIESDRTWKRGKKSIGYRLTSEYQVTHRSILSENDTTFIQKLKNWDAKLISQMDDITKYTYKQLQNIGIHRQAAEQWIWNWYEENVRIFSPEYEKKLDEQNRKNIELGRPEITYNQMLNDMKESYLYQIRCVDEYLWLPKRGKKSKRIYTYLTNLKKELRSFLYLKDTPNTQLVTLDCSNSQPFTLVKILREYFPDGFMPKDVLRYIDLVSEGNLYHKICEELKITEQKEKGSFKIVLFKKILYCANEHSLNGRESKKFQEMFPTVFQIIMQEKKQDYTSLSIRMQRIETSCIVDGVLTDLMAKYGDKVFFTSIHDSIVCEQQYEEEVKNLMLKWYKRVVGMTPHIKGAEIFNLAPDNLMDSLNRPIIQDKTTSTSPVLVAKKGLLFEFREGSYVIAA